MDRVVVRKPEEWSISLMAVGYGTRVYCMKSISTALPSTWKREELLAAGPCRVQPPLTVKCAYTTHIAHHTTTISVFRYPFSWGDSVENSGIPLICFCHCFYRQPRKMQFLFRYMCGEFHSLFFSTRGGIGFPLENIIIKRKSWDRSLRSYSLILDTERSHTCFFSSWCLLQTTEFINFLVVDSGAMRKHPETEGRVRPSWGEI